MRKKQFIVFLSLFGLISWHCNCQTELRNSGDKNTIISRVKYKKGNTEIDTLWVSQNDTIVFKKEEMLSMHPCSKPELSTRYNLIAPVDSAYYFIYNDLQQLILEGKYTYQYTHTGEVKKYGNFYNSKNYDYYKNKSLESIYYIVDGRSYKVEHFDRNKRLKKIRYFDKKSSSIEKIEIYKKGILKETRVYTSFSKYDRVKA